MTAAICAFTNFRIYHHGRTCFDLGGTNYDHRTVDTFSPSQLCLTMNFLLALVHSSLCITLLSVRMQWLSVAGEVALRLSTCKCQKLGGSPSSAIFE